MDPRWAWRISALLHPIVLNFLGFASLFLFLPFLHALYSSQSIAYMLGLHFLNVVLVPVLLLFMLKIKGLVSNLELRDRQERKMPLLLTSVLFLAAYYLFRKLGLHPVLLAYLLASATVMIFTSLLNNFFKISLHAIAVGSFLGLLVALQAYSPADLRPALILAFILGGLILSARLFAGSHTRVEILSGLLLGFFVLWWLL